MSRLNSACLGFGPFREIPGGSERVPRHVVEAVKGHLDVSSKLRQEYARVLESVEEHQVKFAEVDTVGQLRAPFRHRLRPLPQDLPEVVAGKRRQQDCFGHHYCREYFKGSLYGAPKGDFRSNFLNHLNAVWYYYVSFGTF